MPGLSFYRGNFQGRFLMEPTAVSQVVEQFVRVAIIVFSAFAFRLFGWSVYQTGTAAMSGAVIGDFVPMVCCAIMNKRSMVGR